MIRRFRNKGDAGRRSFLGAALSLVAVCLLLAVAGFVVLGLVANSLFAAAFLTYGFQSATPDFGSSALTSVTAFFAWAVQPIYTIQWVNFPFLVWGEVIAAIVVGLLAVYNILATRAAKSLWFEDVSLANKVAPDEPHKSVSLWLRWWLLVAILVAAVAGPNSPDTPNLVRKGAVQVEFAIDVSNSMCAEENRPYLQPLPGQRVPSEMYQWGTRIDQAKRIIENWLPQLAGNEAALITIEGSGYNMWDLTWDHDSPKSAFQVVLNDFINCGAAPGGGADYASGIKTALDEFALPQFNQPDKERFFVLFTDGGFTGNNDELQKMEKELVEKKIHLVLVGLGGKGPITVPKYDLNTGKRSGMYNGLTGLDTRTLDAMKAAVPHSDELFAAPGQYEIAYSFPKKAGGLYAETKQANLYMWFLLLAGVVLLSITFGGNNILPQGRLLLPPDWILSWFSWSKLRSSANKLFRRK